MEPNYETVAQFYSGKSIFITGATGFIGMMLIEKLLTKCPNLDKIYILLREKKGMDVKTRVQNIFNNQLFERLKENNPSSLNKVVPIYGDLTEPGGAISSTDAHTLIEEVSVVIHSAATVKFKETLKNAWKVNVQGTKMILELAKKMKRIGIFIHVSTAYTYTDREVIEEILYPSPADIDEINELRKRDLTEKETKNIIGHHANTYTFTKALSEYLVAKNAVHMPTIIVRPSIVGPTDIGPLKGWLVHWYGATGMVWFTVQGVNRVIYGKYDNILDIIPVDYVANLIIVSGAKHIRRKELNIYHCCSSSCNPLLIGKLTDFCVQNGGNGILLPKLFFFSEQNWLIYLITFVMQVVPAYVKDFLRCIKGQQPKYVKLQSLVTQTRTSVSYFTGNSWIIKANNTINLFSTLSTSDKNNFPFNPANIDWNEYLMNYINGIKIFLKKKK